MDFEQGRIHRLDGTDQDYRCIAIYKRPHAPLPPCLRMQNTRTLVEEFYMIDNAARVFVPVEQRVVPLWEWRSRRG